VFTSLRVTKGAAHDLDAHLAGATPAGVTLRPFVVPGGLGAHKWRDRHLLSITGLGSAGQLLITAENGDVLETDRGSVFAVVGGALCTPPADGRLQPGITRAWPACPSPSRPRATTH